MDNNDLSRPDQEIKPLPEGIFFDPTITSKLEGTTLSSGWVLLEKARKNGDVDKYGHSGGNFSVGYIAQKGVERGFVKVLDFGRAFTEQSGNIMGAMASISKDHNFECNLLKICDDAKLDRIVRVLDRGEDYVDTPSGFKMPIAFIIFEIADGDIRKAVRCANATEVAWKLQMLHNVAVGLQQLHGQQIAHQDLKPSNVLTFDESGQGAKIADLGRSLRKGMDADHDRLDFAADPQYAPPEQVYGIRAETWRDRREGCDLYQLGSLISFLFTSTTPNIYYRMNLPLEILPAKWNGTWVGSYDEVLPHLTAALAGFLEEIRSELPEWMSEDMVSLIHQMCDPVYGQRGDPAARQQVGKPIGMDRFISRLDILAKRAPIEARKLV